MRRLPVFLVLDVSESMAGDNLIRMKEGIEILGRHLRADPHALETVYLSVIAFAGVARTLIPLDEIAHFRVPDLPIGGGTALGAAMEHLMSEVDRAVIRSTHDRKGDWKPLCFLFTDGKPTDDIERALRKWKENYERRCQLVAVGIGRFADLRTLRQLTEHAFSMGKVGPAEFKSMIQWVSMSVVAHSRSVDVGEELHLSRVDESVIKLVERTTEKVHDGVDGDCVVFTGRCQHRRSPYLLVFEPHVTSPLLQQIAGGGAIDADEMRYMIRGCYPINEKYFEWSTPERSKHRVNTRVLIGGAACPHCGAGSTFALCGCGGLMCIGGPGVAICPWCERQVRFSEGENDFDVTRGRG
jgi:uncharacterized protein YegL